MSGYLRANSRTSAYHRLPNNSHLTNKPLIARLVYALPSNSALFASLTLLACASSAVPQFKPNRSDQDLNAIGHRSIGGNVNFFSREKELVLGKQLAQEVN